MNERLSKGLAACVGRWLIVLTCDSVRPPARFVAIISFKHFANSKIRRAGGQGVDKGAELGLHCGLAEQPKLE
jgi:hypothetical protein